MGAHLGELAAQPTEGFYKKFDEILFNPSVSLRSTPPLQGRREKFAEIPRCDVVIAPYDEV